MVEMIGLKATYAWRRPRELPTKYKQMNQTLSKMVFPLNARAMANRNAL